MLCTPQTALQALSRRMQGEVRCIQGRPSASAVIRAESCVRQVLAQLCYAYRPHGGRTVVVLSAREKLEMEKLTRRALPDRERYGTKLVFRQVGPLVHVAAASTRLTHS